MEYAMQFHARVRTQEIIHMEQVAEKRSVIEFVCDQMALAPSNELQPDVMHHLCKDINI